MLYNVNAVFMALPELTGLPLVRHGRSWWGSCRIDGSSHPRKDKLKVYIWGGTIWFKEEGGDRSMSIQQWLLRYTDIGDMEAVRSLLRGQRHDFKVSESSCSVAPAAVRYVPEETVSAMSLFGNMRNPLYRLIMSWASESWSRYGVMTDGDGNTVYWYRDIEGRVCRDKRIRYCEDGHRDKSRGAWSRYQRNDGYSGRCMFGEHLMKGVERAFVVESEKTAVLVNAYFDRPCVAVGGKTQLGLLNGCGFVPVLLPDLDAVEDWKGSGYEVWPWWEHLSGCAELGDKADIGDWIMRNAKKK